MAQILKYICPCCGENELDWERSRNCISSIRRGAEICVTCKITERRIPLASWKKKLKIKYNTTKKNIQGKRSK